MAQSIRKNQRNLLDSGWLDSAGSTRSTEPIQFDATEKKMVELAITFKKVAESELSRINAVNSGQLADSIQLTDVTEKGGVYSIDMKVLFYYAFVNKGVQGLQNKSYNTPFTFRHYHVSRAFMLSIRKWMEREGLKATTKEARRNPLGQERNGVNFETRTNAMAYAIALSIKKKGLKPTGFWDKAADETRKEAAATLGDAVAIDIVNAIMR
ncbi:hypothetical protein [Cnuella takakiae]|nr:hypothetical protein [Cnuella takakiae]OLY91214.1 hypothetical protein BUE76_04340 [Cnuella takakiae]